MTDQPFARTVEAFLAGEAPDRIPADLHGAIVDRARATAQRRLVVRRWPGIGTPRRAVLVGAAVVVAISASLALWAVGSVPIPASTPTPASSPAASPSAVAPFQADIERFSFSYLPPDGRPGDAYPLAFDWSRGADGIRIEVLDQAYDHACGGNGDVVAIRTDAAGLLDDLRSIAHAQLTAAAATSVDGRPALQADFTVDPTCGVHLHTAQSMLTPSVLAFDKPARLTALSVDGNDVLIIAYASDATALAGWLPDARAFIDSIHFMP